MARKPFSACLVISADSTPIHSIVSENGSSSGANASWPASVRTPATKRSAFRKLSSALPRRRFSGTAANSRSSRPAPEAKASKPATVPTGSCEEVTTSVPRSSRGSTSRTWSTTKSMSTRSSSSTGLSNATQSTPSPESAASPGTENRSFPSSTSAAINSASPGSPTGGRPAPNSATTAGSGSSPPTPEPPPARPGAAPEPRCQRPRTPTRVLISPPPGRSLIGRILERSTLPTQEGIGLGEGGRSADLVEALGRLVAAEVTFRGQLVVEAGEVGLGRRDEVQRHRVEAAEAVIDPVHLRRRGALVVGDDAAVGVEGVGSVP